MAYSVFLSHSSADGQLARWIADHSGAVGIEVYLFEGDVQPGTNISEKLKREIQRADAVVVLLTQHSQASAYVQQEIGFAEAHGKLIVPILCAEYQTSQLAMLQGREYVSFDYRDPQTSLQGLLSFLVEKKQAKENVQAALLALGSLFLLAWLGGKR